MAQNTLGLAAAGCDVIVDDVTHFAERVFQDDVKYGEDDDIDVGDMDYSVNAGPTESTDPNFDELPVSSVPASNSDDSDMAGVSGPPEALTTDESGTTDSFTVELNLEPLFDISIDITSEDTTEGLVSDDDMTFGDTVTMTLTLTNWDTPQTVSVQGQDNEIFSELGGGNVTYQIVGDDIRSQDPTYAAFDPAQISVTVINRAGPIFVDDFEAGHLNAWTLSVP